MVKRRVFTDPFIRALRPRDKPYKLAEHAPKGEGRLLVRVLPGGSKEFFYRYRAGELDKTLMLGRYDQTGRNGKTLAGIRKALRLNRDLQRETGDVKEHRQAEARRLDVEARRGSLEQLLQVYVAHLKARKAPSADEAEGILRRHVIGGNLPTGDKVPAPFPLLATKKANEIESDDIQRILGKMVSAGLTRQVNKARAYLGAAFAYGAKADHDPRTVARDGVLFALKAWRNNKGEIVPANPVALVPVVGEYERTGDRTLSEDELREYWKALEGLPIVQRSTLRFNMALACQRPTQLLRADSQAFDWSEKTLLLRDSKGRGGSRDHLLPLTAFALEQLKPLQAINGTPAGELAPPLFSSDGKRALVVETLSDAVSGISKALKRGPLKIPAFGQRDLRRTAETMLQKMGIDKEVRAHLLSHGRSKGVQGKHYERYDFLKEKREALEKWGRHLERVIEGRTAKVVSINEGKAAA